MRRRQNSHRAILCAFLDDSGNYVKRTWHELYEKSGLSKGCFSMRLRDLIKAGSVRGSVIVDAQDQLLNVFEYVRPMVYNRGETKDVLKVRIDKETGNKEAQEYEKVRLPYSSKGTFYLRRKKRR